jgi:hypothetical protein
MTRSLVTASFALLLLSACAERWIYSPPAGVSESQLKADLNACREESGIERLPEDRERMEQQCMMDHGYKMSAAR